MVKIVSLVENTTACGCRTAHGLSLYIETPRHRVLFDVGKDDTFLENAEQLGIDIELVDIVIISHGHYDHGGALPLFLERNRTAYIYIQSEAFAPHFSHRPTGVGYIGLDTTIKDNHRVILLDGDYTIDEELQLFKVAENSVCRSGANSTLYAGDHPDNFDHEQNLIINGEDSILIMGCGHNGVVNIMNRAASYSPKLCIGGFHLTNPSAGKDEPQILIDQIIEELQRYSDVEFYTCHCTGINVYQYMRSKMSNIHYLACGDTLEQK